MAPRCGHMPIITCVRKGIWYLFALAMWTPSSANGLIHFGHVDPVGSGNHVCADRKRTRNTKRRAIPPKLRPSTQSGPRTTRRNEGTCRSRGRACASSATAPRRRRWTSPDAWMPQTSPSIGWMPPKPPATHRASRSSAWREGASRYAAARRASIHRPSSTSDGCGARRLRATATLTPAMRLPPQLTIPSRTPLQRAAPGPLSKGARRSSREWDPPSDRPWGV